MSERTCPHCQAVIQPNTDRRCSSCDRFLDAPSLHLDVTVQRKKPSRVRRGLFIAVLLVGAVLAAEAILQLGRGKVLSAFYDSIGVVALLWVLTGNAYLRLVPTERPRGLSNLPRLAVYIAMGIGLYLGIRIWGSQSELEAIVGTSRPGHYRNEYFGFQLSYDSPWQDVTKSDQKITAVTGAPTLVLSLALAPTDSGATGAKVLLTVVKIPDADAELTSGEHLDMMISTLMQRADRPRDVKVERQTTLAAMPFDRLSLKRPWGEQEIGMTFWATQQRGYLIMITGSYPTRRGLLAIEELLAKMAPTQSE